MRVIFLSLPSRTKTKLNFFVYLCSAVRLRTTAVLRIALTDSSDMFGRIIMAGRFGCAIVNEAMAAEEQVPGVSPGVMRAVRTAHTARQEADRRSREAQARAAAPPQRRPQYYHQQPTGNPAASQPTAAPQQGGSQPQPQHQPTQEGPPVDGRMRYPCHSCNVRGHWARDNACRPEDVRTNLARLAAMLPSAQLALPQPGGSGTSRSSAILSIFSFLVFYKLQFLTVPFLLPLCTCYRTKNSTHSHKNQSSPRRIQLGLFSGDIAGPATTLSVGFGSFPE